MSADLDELFVSLHRQADSIPLGPPEQARRRGRRRGRAQAMLSVVVAVSVVAAGIGVTSWRQEHDRRAAPPAATTRPLPAVGTPIAGPVSYPDKHFFSYSAIDGDRAYATWADETGMRLLGADARTGTATWPAQTVRGSGEFGGLGAVAGMVMVSLEHNDGTDPDRTMYAFDGATGVPRWSEPFDVADDILFYDRVFVHMVAESGRTEAFDVRTGTKLWSRQAGADRPLVSAVLHTAADEKRVAPYGLSSEGSTDRFVQVTKSGRVEVRKMTTGQLVQSVPSSAVSKGTTIRMLVAFDGWAYLVEEGTEYDGSGNTSKPARVHAVDLSGARASAVVYQIEPGARSIREAQVCGSGRVCVFEHGGDDPPAVTAVDAKKGTQLWRIPVPDDMEGLSSLGGRTLVAGAKTVLYDENGKEIFQQAGALSWLDAEHLITLPSPMTPSGGTTGPGAQIVKISAANGERVVLGDAPAVIGVCAFSLERLACPARDGLQMWDLTP